jgi:phosphoglycerate dehydrogenase-like enzyme
MKKILLIDNNHPILQQGLEKLGYQCDSDFTSSKLDIENKMNDYVGIVIRSRFKIDKPFINASPNLKFIARVGAGLESIDTVYAEEKGIHLIAAPEGNRNAVGEHTLGMLLSMLNHFNRADNQIRQGHWLREANRGVELDGKTVGIIGYGNMGSAFAKKLKGFDVNVICYDILPNKGDENCTQVSLKELQAQADIVSIHTPHNKLSHKMINADFIKAFNKSFYLINTARGSAVVTDDLVDALKTGKILGAALDVLEYEKSSFEMAFSYFQNKKKTDKLLQVSEKNKTESSKPENPFDQDQLPSSFEYLIQSDKVLLTPHIAGWTVESNEKLASVIVEKVAKLNL